MVLHFEFGATGVFETERPAGVGGRLFLFGLGFRVWTIHQRRKGSDGKNFRIPPYSKDLGCYCLSVKEDAITIVSRDFEGWNGAEFTLEERKQLEDYRKKLQANQTTDADEKIIREIHLNRPEIITPKSRD